MQQVYHIYFIIITLTQMSLSDFKIITKLGSGAYSSVYKVQRILDNQIYALKKVNLGGLNQKQKQNSLNEIRILASIRHPNIIGYRQAFFDQNTKSLCIIMEFADNGDLYQKILQKTQKKQSFTETEVWEVFIQILRGLKCLHDRKILHRDLKSANVFLTKQGKAKLGDMNVSKISQKGLCQTQTGTPYYASPEVWKDEPYGPKSDIWSLGCVMYQMMTLKPPFQAQDMEGLYKKIIRGDYTKLPLKYSSDLNDLIRILLQTDPYKRPSCQKILGMKIITKRFTEDSDALAYQNPQFLRTIRMPKNIYVLTQNLPKPNYFSSKKQLNGQKNSILANQTQKMHKKSVDASKNNKLFPKLNHNKEVKQVYSHNKSVILKNTSIIEAARFQVNIQVNNSNNLIQKNHNINNRQSKIKIGKNEPIREKEQIKARQRKLKKQKNTQQTIQISQKPKQVIDLEGKITQIQRIYGDNNIKLMRKKDL